MTTVTPQTVPTAPGGVPVLGHLPALLRDPLGFLGSLARVGDAVEISLGPRRMTVVTSPALVHTLLTALSHDCPRGTVQGALREAFGDGLLMSEGALHRERRRAVQPAFTAERVAALAGVVGEAARERIERWSPGRAVDVAGEMTALALDVVARALFGVRLAEGPAAAFRRALPDLVRGQIARSLCPHPLFARLPLPLNRRFDAAVRVLDAVVDRTVGGPDGPDGRDGAPAGPLRDAVDPATGRRLDRAALRSEAVSLFGAGTETVSSTLTWLFHELMGAPEVYARLLGELEEAYGDGLTGAASGEPGAGWPGEAPPYLRAVLREVLRLHAPNAFLTRTAAAGVRLGPYAVAAGTELLYSLTALHRDPARYPDPLRFDPDRWADGEGAGDRRLFLPFGAGRHKCVGEGFAWMELAVIAATVLLRWRLTPLPGARAREVVWTTVQARDVVMTVAPRAVRVPGPPGASAGGAP
ncbi:cytochrome P450 [Streptomyces sp. NPDC020141]|uniref:cytochrome P450 n=1 Tax=Streptomyces sp. NPDC020141 TaxID=3365065 RepID=UPI00378A714A